MLTEGLWEEKERRGGEGGQSQGGEEAGGPAPGFWELGGWPAGTGFSPLELRLLLSGTWWCSGPGKAPAGMPGRPCGLASQDVDDLCGTLHDHLRASPAHTALPLSNSPGSGSESPSSGSLLLPSGRARGQVTSFLRASVSPLPRTHTHASGCTARLHALTLTRTRTLPHPLHTHATHLSHPCTPALGHRTTPFSPDPPPTPATPTATSVRTHPRLRPTIAVCRCGSS